MTIRWWWRLVVGVIVVFGVLFACTTDADGVKDEQPTIPTRECPAVTPCTIEAAVGSQPPATTCATLRAIVHGRSTTQWSDAQRDAWTASCVQLLSGPPEVPEPQSEPEITPCRGLDVLQQRREAMTNQSLPDAEWIEFGKTLAVCAPYQRPWETMDLTGRAQYMEWYVVPYVNRDVRSGGRFQASAAQSYKQLVRRWLTGS